ncbi:MAG: CDC27 family protein, partial [Bacteriovoracaceae bacterium]
MQKQTSSSPILVKYLKAYEQDPHSRVFAPLAETYRKMGMNDKAMKILRDGIKSNPDYALGYLGLSFCYFDQGQFQLAYNTLRPFVNSNRDNLRLQKLFAQVCYRIGHLEEALETYKYILFINPRDDEAKERVSELEDNYVKTEVIDQPILESEEDDSDYFEIRDLSPRPMGAEEIRWVQKDLSADENEESEQKSDEASPVITHTLVDLYCAQGHFGKAL